MKVLIVGAGIAGLALGAHLRKAGHDVTIIEKADALKKVGFVLGLWGAGLTTLGAFNVEDKITDVGHFPSRFNLRTPKGKIIRRFNFEDVVHTYGKAVTLLRSDFHEILLNLNDRNRIKFETSISSIEERDEGVVAFLTNGQQETYDLIVGADGIHSKVRELVFGAGHTKYSGLTSWIVMTDKPLHLRPNITEIWAGNTYFGVFPYKSERLCAIFGLKEKQGELDEANGKELLQAKFGNFGWIVKDILDQIKPNDQIFHTDWNEVYMKTWTKGRVVLIGDAAHAMLPTAGSGASLALEDAYWLALELSANPDDLQTALKKFVSRQQAVVATLRSHTDFIGKVIKLSGPASVIRNALIKKVPASWVSRDLRHLMAIQNKNLQHDNYSFVTSWEFDAPIDTVKRAFADYKKWPDWWKVVRQTLVTPGKRKAIMVHCVFGLWLYNLSFDLEEKETTENELRGKASGDLYGTAVVRFAQKKTTSTVTVRWEVIVERPWIRAASRFFRPVFYALHNFAMRSGAKGLAKEMHCQVVDIRYRS